MSKETFVLNAFRLLLENPSVSLDEMDPSAHGISRVTAWRALSNLRKAGIVSLSGEWSITQQAREMFCGKCKHYQAYVEEAQRKHREISLLLLQRARQP